jgi:glycosyltransferase involved in cell wall biosynthesis
MHPETPGSSVTIPPRKKPSLLLVANWDSGVGYAWWLMESFWAALARRYAADNTVILAYPSISTIPDAIKQSPLSVVTQEIGKSLIDECRFIRRNAVKVIYFSDRANYSLRYLAYRLFGVKLIIVHDHSPGRRPAAQGLRRRLKSLLHRIPGLSANGCIGASDYLKQRLVEAGCIPQERCHSAPNGLPERALQRASHSIRADLGIPDNKPLMVMTGRANRYKNVSFVLACMNRLTKAGYHLHFLFCGDGPDLEHFLDESRSLGITRHVTFAGRRSDIASILPQCNFAVHPSHGEVGYSLSILEYMQAGLPVIVPDNPSVCGATRHMETGMIYSENDAAALDAAVIWLLSHTAESAAMGINARSVVANEYNLSRTHNALLRAFDRIDHARVMGAGYLDNQWPETASTVEAENRAGTH